MINLISNIKYGCIIHRQRPTKRYYVEQEENNTENTKKYRRQLRPQSLPRLNNASPPIHIFIDTQEGRKARKINNKKVLTLEL